MSTVDLSTLWKASHDLPQQRIIETELKNRVLRNRNFTREFFFELTIKASHAATVIFIPGSESYLHYGEQITIEMLLTKSEQVDMIQSSAEKDRKFTYGLVLAKVLVKDGLSDAQIELLRTRGFNTSDVLEVLHL